MPALCELGLANLDAALVRLRDDITLRPVSELRLVSGGICSDRHRIAYNKLTAFLHGDDGRKESIKDIPEAKRVVCELDELADFCKADPACASEDNGLTQRTENPAGIHGRACCPSEDHEAAGSTYTIDRAKQLRSKATLSWCRGTQPKGNPSAI